MKVKSILASLGACAIAMSAMALSASAADLMTKVGNADSAKVYDIPTDGLDLSKLDKVVAEVSVDTTLVNGCIGYNKEDGTDKGAWTSVNQEAKADAGPVNAEWVAEGLDGTVKGSVQVQFWWVQPQYDEAGTESGDGTAVLKSVKLYDKDGKELTAGDNKDDKNDNTTATTTATTKAAGGNTTKAGATKTGDAGVGIAISGLALAGIAAVASRKKH